MSIISELASMQGRKDEEPNKEIDDTQKDIVDSEDQPLEELEDTQNDVEDSEDERIEKLEENKTDQIPMNVYFVASEVDN